MGKSIGINDVKSFDFMDSPLEETLNRSFEQLYALGALNEDANLTELGRRMAEFPTDPTLSKMLLTSDKLGVSEEATTIVAMLECECSVFYRPKDKHLQADSAHKKFYSGCLGDHIALMTIFNEWEETNFSKQFCFENFIQFRTMKRARDIREQLIGSMERSEIVLKSNRSDHDAICKCVISGFFYNVATLCKKGSYQTIKTPMSVYIHPSSGLSEVCPGLVVYDELVLTSKEYMRIVSEIKPEW